MRTHICIAGHVYHFIAPGMACGVGKFYPNSPKIMSEKLTEATRWAVFDNIEINRTHLEGNLLTISMPPECEFSYIRVSVDDMGTYECLQNFVMDLDDVNDMKENFKMTTFLSWQESRQYFK